MPELSSIAVDSWVSYLIALLARAPPRPVAASRSPPPAPGRSRCGRVTPRTEYALAVVRRDTGDLIGMARLALGEQRSGQIGFAIRPDHWRQGFGLQTVRLLLELGFRHLSLHRIWGARSPLNIDSDRVMVKAGMTEEGRIRDHVYVRGAWRDSITHSILEPDWEQPPCT